MCVTVQNSHNPDGLKLRKKNTNYSRKIRHTNVANKKKVKQTQTSNVFFNTAALHGMCK